MKFRLREKWQGFKKRSWAYKMALVYAVLGVGFLVLAMYIMVSLSDTYVRDPSSFQTESLQDLRSVVFVTLMNTFCGLSAILALFSFVAMLSLLDSDSSKRLKKLEEFIDAHMEDHETDPLSYRKRGDLE